MIQASLFDKPTIRTYAGDVTARKHGNNPRSVEAFGKVDKAGDCEKLLRFLQLKGDGTNKEFAAWLGKFPNATSGRFTEMAGVYIVRTGFKREGADVWRLK